MVGDPSPTLDSTAELVAGAMSVHTTWHGQAAVVSVRGVVDALTAPELTTAVQETLSSSPRALIIDLSAVDFLASAGMSVLVATQQELGSAARLDVVADGPVTRRPMKLLGLDSMLALHTTLQEALSETAVGEAMG